MSNIALIVVIALLAIISFYKGKGVLFSIIVSFYPAIVIYKAFPYTENFLFMKDTNFQVFLSHLVVFLVFFLLTYFAVQRITYGNGSQSGVGGMVDAILLSLSVTLLSLVLTLHILPVQNIYHLSGNIMNFFTSDMGYFISLAAPIALVFYISKKSYY